MKKFLFVLAFAISQTSFAGDHEEAKAAYDRGDYEKALSLLLPIAESGDKDALGNVGNIYGFGWGVPVDCEKALSYWHRAAEKHVPKSMGNIATYHFKGMCGLPKDYALAASWYLKAAEHQHVLSMITLSGLLDQGIGIKKDKVKALAWAGLAASNPPSGDIEKMASFQLKQASQNATKDDLDEAQKLMYEYAVIIDANLTLYKDAH